MPETLDTLIAQHREPELYFRLMPLCYRAGQSVFGSRPVPEDFAHEVAAYLVIDSRRFKAGAASFSTWAYRRAQSRAKNVLQANDTHKRKGITISISSDVHHNTPDPRYGVLRYAKLSDNRVRREENRVFIGE